MNGVCMMCDDIYVKAANGYYKTGLPYDDTEFAEATEKQIKELDDLRLTVKERNKEIERLKALVSEQFKKVRIKYQEDQNRLHCEFLKDVEEYFGFADYPDKVKEAIHSWAYENGNLDGYSGILGHYDMILDFAEICKEEFCKCDWINFLDAVDSIFTKHSEVGV